MSGGARSGPAGGQLAFDLPPRTGYARPDFFVSAANRDALAAIDGWARWPEGRMLLTGPAGSGKSHLAAIWAAQAGGTVAEGGALGADAVEGLAAHGAVAVDDANAVAGHPAREAALFHLHNRMRERGHPLLLTAAAPPRDWGLGLPDLASRMQAMAATRLGRPDDALLRAVLVKLFADRQVVVEPALIPYVVARMDRSIAAARALVASLDALSLERGRPISRALAAEALEDAEAWE